MTTVTNAQTETVKATPQTYDELLALKAAGHVEGPWSPWGIETSKAYLNLINGYTFTGLKSGHKTTVPGHPEDADAFLKSPKTGKILVWRLKLEDKYCVVRKCASGTGHIVVRTSDIQFKRYHSDRKPSGAMAAKAAHLVVEDDPGV